MTAWVTALGALPLLAVQEAPAEITRETGGLLEQVSIVIEVGLLTWLYYSVLRFLHGTRGLSVLKGVLLTVGAVVVGLVLLNSSVGLDFPRLEPIGRYLLPAMVVVLAVLFQPELRRGFTRLGEKRALGGGDASVVVPDVCAAIMELGRQRRGALVVFEQQTGLAQAQETGVPLDAALTGDLIGSIFYPKSPLHDGAVLVREGRIVAACCMLPLSDSVSLSRELGTRHRAALGVTEESDAVVIVVSEETGTVSVCSRARFTVADDEESLRRLLDDTLQDTTPAEAAA